MSTITNNGKPETIRDVFDAAIIEAQTEENIPEAAKMTMCHFAWMIGVPGVPLENLWKKWGLKIAEDLSPTQVFNDGVISGHNVVATYWELSKEAKPGYFQALEMVEDYLKGKGILMASYSSRGDNEDKIQ